MSRALPRFHRNNPSLPAPGGSTVVQINMVGSIEGQETINTFYYVGSPPGALTVTDLANALTAWQAAFLATFRGCCNGDWTVSGVECLCLTQPLLVTQQSTANAGAAGTVLGGHEPTVTSVCLSRYTGTKGQHGRGRIYMPGVPSLWVTASAVTNAAGITAYNNMANALLTGITFSGIAYAAALVQRAKVSPRNLVGVAPIAQVAFRPLIATTRRRRIGRGK
jgi:hypothetical protein